MSFIPTAIRKFDYAIIMDSRFSPNLLRFRSNSVGTDNFGIRIISVWICELVIGFANGRLLQFGKGFSIFKFKFRNPFFAPTLIRLSNVPVLV